MKRRRRGQGLVELALSLPLLVLVLLGALHLSRLLAVQTTMTEVSADAARLWSRLEHQHLRPADVEGITRELLAARGVDTESVIVNARVKHGLRRVELAYHLGPTGNLRLKDGVKVGESNFALRAWSAVIEERPIGARRTPAGSGGGSPIDLFASEAAR